MSDWPQREAREKGAWSTALLLIGSALALAGCEAEPAPDARQPTPSVRETSNPPAASVRATSDPPAPSVQATSDPPVPSATAAATPCPWSPSIADELTFVDCNARPTQRDYPECYNYAFLAVDGASGCPPSPVELAITGWPGIVDTYRVRVEVAAGGSQLRLLAQGEEGKPVAPAQGRPKAGALVATLYVEAGRVVGFRAGNGLLAHNRGKVLKP